MSPEAWATIALFLATAGLVVVGALQYKILQQHAGHLEHLGSLAASAKDASLTANETLKSLLERDRPRLAIGPLRMRKDGTQDPSVLIVQNLGLQTAVGCEIRFWILVDGSESEIGLHHDFPAVIDHGVPCEFPVYSSDFDRAKGEKIYGTVSWSDGQIRRARSFAIKLSMNSTYELSGGGDHQN